jgi:primosomal protein N' (replication factor Y)
MPRRAVDLPEVPERARHLFWAWAEKVKRSAPRFPRARVTRPIAIPSPASEYEVILQGFRDGDFDILVGTQMIAKGHDIPNVTLVGVVSADGLGMPDFRAAERTFQLAHAAGRAAAAICLARAWSNHQPDHYAVRMAATTTIRRSMRRS